VTKKKGRHSAFRCAFRERWGEGGESSPEREKRRSPSRSKEGEREGAGSRSRLGEKEKILSFPSEKKRGKERDRS